MSLLSGDPLTQLAFSVYENKGVFALLLGSGLSRAAEIPTGWEITLDLIRRVAAAQGVDDQLDWEKWYRERVGQEPNYSTLLEELAASPDERRSVLHSYIEPTEEDREEGRKVPTTAHYAVADLVRAGYVRVIVTTNFDRLLENALRERGVEPTIIASADALKGAEPITHSTCYIVKLHGDYKDARIRNTDAELSDYPIEYDDLLDRILDEHGLIVCGWSGEWDHALRGAMLRAPNRRYPMFWAARSKLNDSAAELAKQRDARIVTIGDADSFFSGLWQRIQTLAQSQHQSPLSTDLLVNSTKRFLSRPEYRIQLDELIAEETNRLLEKLDSPIFGAQGSWSQEAFRERIAAYEAAAEPLARMAGVLGRWGAGHDLALVLDVLRSICARADKAGGGLVAWLEIRSYPAVLIFTGYGLGLVREQRWEALHRLLRAEVSRQDREAQRVVDRLFLWSWDGGDNKFWQALEGLDKRKTALSDHLLDVFATWSKGFVGAVPDFEYLFEQFEILASFVHLERAELPELEQALASQDPSMWVGIPVGRSVWHTDVRKRIFQDIQSRELMSELLKAGFAKGSEAYLTKAIQNYNRMVGRFSW